MPSTYLSRWNRSCFGRAKTGTARCLVLVAILALCAGADSVHAQLGITGFSLFGGIEGSRLGSASAVGDFNGDGFDDLAVGMPELDLSAAPSAGGVYVILGGPGGWASAQLLTSDTFGRDREAGDRFGSALATGDFDDDGSIDLVIGIPGRTILGADSAGEIIVAYTTAGGRAEAVGGSSFGSPLFDIPRTQVFSQFELPGTPEADDLFGFSLATGDLSADGVDDLAVGSPFEDIQGPLGPRQDVGTVHVIYGFRGFGLVVNTSQQIDEDTPGVGLNANADERFGFALTIGQFTHNANADLAVGVPGEAVFGSGQQGAVILFPGAPGGLDPVGGEEVALSQQTAGILGTLQDGDEFGYALAAGNFDGDSWTDLAIGVPGESELGTTESGAVQVLYGGAVGLTTNGDQFLVESSIDADVDAFDRLGMALVAGDFDGDGRDDLAMGAPLDNSLGFANAGEVTVVYGSPTGVTFTGHQIFDMIFFDTLEVGDQFGSTLAVGRFFSRFQGGQDLAVGVPRRGSPVGSEPGLAVAIRSISIFADGFETGDVSGWSNSVP